MNELEAHLIVPVQCNNGLDKEVSLTNWGFKDSFFIFTEDDSVILTGDRYSLCGQKFNRLLDHMRDKLHPEIGPDNIWHEPLERPRAPAAVIHKEFVQAIQPNATRLQGLMVMAFWL